MLLQQDRKILYIIDGYGFIFRAFYAVPNLKTQDGLPIGAVYGFFKMLISLINSVNPNYMVVALDTGKRTFRNDIYDQFIEDKAIEEFFKNNECKKHFENINITLNDIKNLDTYELIDRLNIDKTKLINICNEYKIDPIKPPKVLTLLLFLEMTDCLQVQNYKTQYKANRKETPDDLKGQFKIIRELIDTMNIPSESAIGYEADDVIATLSKKAINNGYQVIVVSADKDLCQLVKDGKISIFDPVKKKYLNEQGVIEKFGVSSDQICDYLSIVGDSCDNILGVNGIGPKGAIKLLNKYNNIENILLHLSEIEDSTKQKLINSKDILKLARELVSLKYDAIDITNFEKYKLNINHQGLTSFVKKYGFKLLDQQQKNNGFNKQHYIHQTKSQNNSNEKKNTQYKQNSLFDE